MPTRIHKDLLEQHRTFLSSEYNQGRTETITEWVEKELLRRSSVTSKSKFAFFEAQKTLLTDFIKANDLDGVVILMQAIDHADFDKKFGPFSVNLIKFRINQCVVLSKAIIAAENHLKTETRLHRSLGRMLYNRFRKQQETDTSMWRPLLHEKVPRALGIVQFRSPVKLGECSRAAGTSSGESKRRCKEETGPSQKLQRPSTSSAADSETTTEGAQPSGTPEHRVQAAEQDSGETDRQVLSSAGDTKSGEAEKGPRTP